MRPRMRQPTGSPLPLGACATFVAVTAGSSGGTATRGRAKSARSPAHAAIEPDRPQRSTDPNDIDPGTIGGGPGAGDASSGGGAGAGIPGGGTDMRTNGRFDGGDVQKDRRKLFPEAKTKRRRAPDGLE